MSCPRCWITEIKGNFCSKDRENMVKFWEEKTIALERVDFFQREWNCLEKHEGSDSMLRVVQEQMQAEIAP